MLDLILGCEHYLALDGRDLRSLREFQGKFVGLTL